jgi:hypothetical protein
VGRHLFSDGHLLSNLSGAPVEGEGTMGLDAPNSQNLGSCHHLAGKAHDALCARHQYQHWHRQMSDQIQTLALKRAGRQHRGWADLAKVPCGSSRQTLGRPDDLCPWLVE